MRFLKLTIAYQGTAYGGWQRQSNRITVQSVLETALRRVTTETIRTAASGRTDAGVHARGPEGGGWELVGSSDLATERRCAP